ncbi:hypothetical protein LUD75_09270 [Epilithonimonas sp. JDS]|uniref:hypothetical protein n=1 Tax=Epilithonimonas sp. JDS TaxID=2902797 RepID=UPI001E3B0BCC|nr:hypothetical protein [Epilithonimonas sp. JDS]MCD9854894.1 hypothetical protein [Epilithonimonas sp. JDS]
MKATKLCALLLFPASFFSQINSEKFVIDDDGITVEKADSTKKYDEVFNNNNSIYSLGKKFTYSYYYQNAGGEKFLIKKGQNIMQPQGHTIPDWEFVPFERQDNETINHIILQTFSGNPFQKEIPEYNQTAIGYDHKMNNGQSFTMEMTGAIENEMNVWIHPPRSNFFKILELNPFPYIKAPYKIGNQWNWKLKIGDHWAEKRWLEWKGEIENNYAYEIIDKKNITTKLGNLECYVIDAKAKSRIGETELTSYYNFNFGFVKLEYKNIDGTKTVLELEKVE